VVVVVVVGVVVVGVVVVPTWDWPCYCCEEYFMSGKDAGAPAQH
jgi:hypothetical protein